MKLSKEQIKEIKELTPYDLWTYAKGIINIKK